MKYTRYVDAIICTFWRENTVLKIFKKKSRDVRELVCVYLHAATCVLDTSDSPQGQKSVDVQVLS